MSLPFIPLAARCSPLAAPALPALAASFMPAPSISREILGNIDWLSKSIFLALALAAMACFVYGVYRRVRLWRIGRGGSDRISWHGLAFRLGARILDLSTFGRCRPWASAAHLLLFSGFMVLLLGTILIAIEHYAGLSLGRDADNPLFHKGLYFAVYEFTLDLFGLALLLGCGWFVHRRLRAKSSIGRHWSDMMVLAALMLLAVSGYVVEGLRIIHEQTSQPGYSFVGYGVARLFELSGIERREAAVIHLILWWLHAVLALALIAAIPYTRLLHALAGAVNLAFAERPLGVMLPVSLEQVEQTGIVGAASLQDFSRRQLVQLDACVSCGRCQDACPAFEAGKPLSPRDVVQDIAAHLSPASSVVLPGETISAETLWSCTTCHACVTVCPLGVDPLGFIVDLRRNLVGEAQLRGTAATALQKMQRSGNPWGLPVDQRLAWAQGLDVPLAEQGGEFDVLYWVGCAAAYDRRTQRVARAVAQLLTAAGVRFAVLGSRERCTGESARRVGDEFLFQELATANLEVLNQCGVQRIVTHCPHCLNSLRQDYPQFGGEFEVVHHTQLLAELVAAGRLKIKPPAAAGEDRLTYHDPCYLARVHGETDAPRELLQNSAAGGGLTELPRRGRETACCGAGGGRMWFDDAPGERTGSGRVQELVDSRAQTVAVSCPFCLTMLSDGLAARDQNVQVQDVAEILLERLEIEV